MLSLPYVALECDEVIPSGGATFVQYNWYRDGIRIATVPTIATPTYDDYLAKPGIAHSYEVSWTAQIGGDLVESTKAPASATLTFTGAYLHDVATPAQYAEVYSPAVSVDSRQEIAFVRARGRRAPTAQVGEGLGRVISLTTHPGIHTDPARWRALEALQLRQYDDEGLVPSGAVLCLRLGHMAGERYFVQIDRLQRGDGTALHAPSVNLQEVHYDEER